MKKQIIVGGSLRGAARRVSDAIHRVEEGETVEVHDSATFVTWSALASVMTDKRHELLRHLYKRPTASIRALACDLERDFNRVHEDVKALEGVGLLERDSHGVLHVDYVKIDTSIRVDSAA